MDEELKFTPRPDHELRTPLRRTALSEGAPLTTFDAQMARYQAEPWIPAEERPGPGPTLVLSPEEAAAYFPKPKPVAEDLREAKLASLREQIDATQAEIAAVKRTLKRALKKYRQHMASHGRKFRDE